MVEKTKLSARDAYKEARKKAMTAHLKGMTKDRQIQELKEEYADARADVRLILGHWGESIKRCGFHLKISVIHYIVAFLMGIAWGIILFA